MTEMNSVVLEIDPVFMYQIGDKLKSCLKASEWDIPNPVWNGKLQIVKVSSNRHQVQFVNSSRIFGVVANKEHVGSPVFQKVLDSNRYFTTEVKNARTGKNEVIGIGFMNRSDGSKLLEALDHYFTSKDDSTTIDAPMKCNENDQIKVEIKTEVPENSQVEINTPQESHSDNGTHTRCDRNSWLRTDTTTDIPAHTRKGQEKRAGTSHDEHSLESSILTSGGNHKYKITESESTFANNSEGETPCSIPKKRKIEPQSQDLMHIDDAQPEQNDSQESVDSFRAVQEPSGECSCSTSASPSEVFLNNKNGAFCLDPVTRELMCPFCGFSPHAKRKMKLLLSHWQKDGDMKETSTCSLCYIIFSTPEQRLKHVNALHAVCSICSMEFGKQKLRNLHMNRVHNCNKQVEIHDTAVDEHNADELILSNCDEDKFEKEDGEIISDNNSEEEAHCRISQKETIELQSHDRNKHEIELMHIDSPSEENRGQESVDCIHTGKEPSGSCISSFLPSEGLSNNQNGAYCLDPVTLKFICPLCGFKTDSKYKMKLLLSHWREHHDMTSPQTCRLCYILFSTPEQRLSHLKVHRFVCAICLQEVKLKKHFLGHIERWHIKRGFRISPHNISSTFYMCSRCPKKFVNIKNLMHHFKLTNSTTQCSATTTIAQEYEKGITYFLQVGGKSQYICHMCPISKFRSVKLNKLINHWKKVHNLTAPHTCKLCHLVFSTAQQRLNHSIALHKVCSICSLEFEKQKLCNRHMKTAHNQIQRKKEERADTTRNDREPTAVRRNLPSVDEDKYETEEQKATIDDNSEEKSPCRITKKEKTGSQTQDENKLEIRLLHTNSQPKEIVGQESVDGFYAVQTPSGDSGQCVLSELPSVGVPDNENGSYSSDPTSLELICPLCSFKTPSKTLLLSHWRTVHGLNRHYTCSLCSLIFLTAEEHLAHTKFHHFVCSICSFEFTEQKHLLKHTQIWHKKLRFRMSSGNDNHYRCNRCSKEFHNIETLMNHLRPTNKTSQCSLLPAVTATATEKSATTIENYESGINYFSQVDEKNQFACHLCPTPKFYALTTKDLLNHWKTEHDLRDPHTCRLCHLLFSAPEHRLHHINALHIVCSICTLEFAKRKNLNIHMRKVHARTPKSQEKRPDTTLDACQSTGTQRKKRKNKCKLCSIEFSTSKEHRSHMVIYHQFVCQICSSVFTLQKHLDSHTINSHPN